MYGVRKTVLSVLAATLALGAGRPALAGIAIVAGKATTGTPGRVAAPISLKNAPSPSPVAGIQLDVLFPPSLSAPSCTAAPGVPLAGTHVVTGAPDTPPGLGRLRLVFVDLQALAPIAGGPLATCTFTAAPGSYGLSGMGLSVVDAAGAELEATLCTGGCC